MPRPGSATVLALQRTLGNHATTRFVQGRERPARRLLRYTGEHLQAVGGNLKLPDAKVQAMLETGEATGLFNEVYELATSKFILNPDGLATMLGSFKAIMPKKEPVSTEPSTQAAKPAGASGFLRELMYGLEHVRQGLYVQYGAMAPDDLAAALDRVNLKKEAEGVRTQSRTVTLGDHLGGDVVVWGGGRKDSGVAGETVQHKVVEGKDDFAVANELRNAIHQLAGRNKELAIEGTQRTADIVVMPANAMATAEPGKLVELIKGRMADEFQGKKLSTYVDVVRITVTACQVEYDAKTGKETIVRFESQASPQQALDAKTPAKWDAAAISRPATVRALPETLVAPEKPVAEMSTAEVALRIDEIEQRPGKEFALMAKSELTTVKTDLEGAKKEWLAVKTAPATGRRDELVKTRDAYVEIELGRLAPPQDKRQWKTWRETNQKTLGEQWDKDHASEVRELKEKQEQIDQIEQRIRQAGGKEAELLTKFDQTIAGYAKQIELLGAYEAAAKERNDWVNKKVKEATGADVDREKDRELIQKLQLEWATLHPEKAPLVEQNLVYSRINAESIARDNLVKQQKKEQRAKDEQHVREVCQPLLDAVGKVKKGALGDLMDSLIAVLQQARHAAAVGALCREIADQLMQANELATKGSLEKAGLEKFTGNLAKRKDYNNLQGDLGEVTHAVRMALLPADQRNGPVVLGSTALEPDKSLKQPQEVDVSFESKDKDVLDLHEVAWDIKTLESKLLSTDKQSQREGYARIIQAQKGAGTRKEIRMIYIVHKAGADAEQAVRSNVAPVADKLGSDVAAEVKPGESGGMAKVLAKRGYFLVLGGKLYTPQEIGGWVTQ